MMNTVNTLRMMKAENELVSKVNGRRNYVIRTSMVNGKKIVVYAGNYGVAADRGLLEEKVTEIAAKNIRWYTFTRKADFMNAVNILKNAGVEFWCQM